MSSDYSNLKMLSFLETHSNPSGYKRVTNPLGPIMIFPILEPWQEVTQGKI